MRKYFFIKATDVPERYNMDEFRSGYTNEFSYFTDPAIRDLAINGPTEDTPSYFKHIRLDSVVANFFKLTNNLSPISFVLESFKDSLGIEGECEYQVTYKHTDVGSNTVWETIVYKITDHVYLEVTKSFTKSSMYRLPNAFIEDVFNLYQRAAHPDKSNDDLMTHAVAKRKYNIQDFKEDIFFEYANEIEKYIPVEYTNIYDLHLCFNEEEVNKDEKLVLAINQIFSKYEQIIEKISFKRDMYNGLFGRLMDDDNEDIIENMFTIVVTPHGARLKSLPAIKLNDVDVETNYNITVYDPSKPVESGSEGLDYKALTSALTSDESGIVIINGPVGTGKSRLISHALHQISKQKTFSRKIILINDRTLNLLLDPNYGDMLSDLDGAIIVCEDASSDQGEWTVPAGMISEITDGVVSSTFMNKMVFISNAETDKIPDALLRPGRCDYYALIDNLNEDKVIQWVVKNNIIDVCVEEIQETLKEKRSISLAQLYSYKKKSDKAREFAASDRDSSKDS